MRWVGFLGLGLLGALAVAALALLIWRLTLPEPRYPGFPATDVPGITNPMRTAAMVSVQVYANTEAEDPLRRLVMPMSDAVDLLDADRLGPAGTSRIRRAAATLASHGLEYSDGGWVLERFAAELQDLGIGRERVEALALSTLPPGLAPGLRFPIIADWFLFLTPACPWEKLQGGISDWSENAPNEWDYTVEVPRRVSDIAHPMDPQVWDKSSTYFPKTYLADVPAPCCTQTGTSSCSFSSSEPPEAPYIPAGKPYGPLPLYEDYCTDNGGECASNCGAFCIDIQNLMCATTSYDNEPIWNWLAPCADEYEVNFGLARWLRSTVLGVTQSHGGGGNLIYAVKEDKGWITVRRLLEREAESGQDWSKVHLVKKLKFASPSVTEPARGLLRAYAHEIGEQIADQACFDLPETSWGPVW